MPPFLARSAKSARLSVESSTGHPRRTMKARRGRHPRSPVDPGATSVRTVEIPSPPLFVSSPMLAFGARAPALARILTTIAALCFGALNRVMLRGLLMAPMTGMPAVLQAQVAPAMAADPGISIAEWLIPLAIILVLVLVAMAKVGRISWAWSVGAIFGLVIAFGLPRVVSWFTAAFAG